MTELYINNQLCDLPTDLKLTLVTENLYFSKASTYTYDIELPITKLSNNARIFANVNRLDKTILNQSLPARLVVDNRVILDGSAVIVGIKNNSISIQLLQGNSELNWKQRYEKTYIDELDLGKITEWGLIWNEDHSEIDPDEVEPSVQLNPNDGLPQFYYWTQKNFSDYNNGNVVVTPLVNQDTGDIVNPIGTHTEFTDQLIFCLRNPAEPWTPVVKRPYYIYPKKLAPQPKLKIMVDKIFQALNFNLVVNELDENEFYNDLIIANSSDVKFIAEILPHITVVEFVEQLQNLFNCIVEIDGNESRILLRKNVYGVGVETEKVENVVDEYEIDIDTETEVSDSDKAKLFDIAYPDYNMEFLGDDFKDVPIITEPDKLTSTPNPYVFGRTLRNIKVCSPRQHDGEIKGTYNIDLWEKSTDSDDTIALKMVPLMPFDQITTEEHHYFTEWDESFHVIGHVYADVVLNIPTAVGRNTQNYGQNIQEILEALETPEGKLTIDKICLGFLTKTFAFEIPPTLGTSNVTYNVLTSKQHAKLEDQLNEGQYIADSEQIYEMGLRWRLKQDLTPVKNLYEMFYKNTNEIVISNTTLINFVGQKVHNALSLFLIKNQLYACKQIKYTITAKGFDKIAEGEFYKI